MIVDIIYIILIVSCGYLLAVIWQDHDDKRLIKWQKQKEEELRKLNSTQEPLSKFASLLQKGDKLKDGRIVQQVTFHNDGPPIKVRLTTGAVIYYPVESSVTLAGASLSTATGHKG